MNCSSGVRPTRSAHANLYSILHTHSLYTIAEHTGKEEGTRMLVWNRQHLARLQVQRCVFEHVHAVLPTRGRAHVQGHLKRVARQCWIMQVFYQNRGASS